jgi:hypothetical protein
MHQYIQDTRFAVEGLIGLITQDAADYAALQEQHERAAAKDAYYHAAFQLREMGPDANYWYAMRHEAGTALNGLAAELRELEDRIVNKHQSLAALSGAVLQIAKQGISTEYRHPERCPNGRKVFGVDIKCLIWASRNQAIHYENPKEISYETRGVFAQLNAGRMHVAPLDPACKVNCAYDILQILGWASYPQYEADMRGLLGSLVFV